MSSLDDDFYFDLDGDGKISCMDKIGTHELLEDRDLEEGDSWSPSKDRDCYDHSSVPPRDYVREYAEARSNYGLTVFSAVMTCVCIIVPVIAINLFLLLFCNLGSFSIITIGVGVIIALSVIRTVTMNVNDAKLKMQKARKKCPEDVVADNITLPKKKKQFPEGLIALFIIIGILVATFGTFYIITIFIP